MSGKAKGPQAGANGVTRRRKLISEEDRALWDLVASRLEPTRGKSRVRDVELDVSAFRMEVDLPAASAPPARQAVVRPTLAADARSPASPVPRASPRSQPPEPLPLERRKVRRIARGLQEIEARLDLHGMTQEDAHYALVGFVRRCQATGMRTVLVITGKGAVLRDDDEVVPRQRGVLRRNVPRWLAGPEIGSLVVSHAPAHSRHGGEGALYVQLRRKG